MANLNDFISLLSSGCVEGFFEEFNNEKATECEKILDSLLNTMRFNYKEFVDEIAGDVLAKGYFAEMCDMWLFILNKEFLNKQYDYRNELSVQTGAAIYNGIYTSFNNYYEELFSSNDKPGDISEFLIKKMRVNHRTLKQTFSSAVFYFLSEYSLPLRKEDLSKLIKDGKISEDFYVLPFI